MNILQHYYISLERIPERRAAWNGCQEAWGYDFKDLTYYYATDILKYPSKRAIYEHMSEAGLSYPKDFLVTEKEDWGRKHLTSALTAFHASFMIVFHHISQQVDGWYIVWEADCVLDMPYTGFKKLVERDRPADANILLLHGGHSTHKPHEKFHRRRYAETHPYFYVGAPVIGATKCAAVTPAGARDILRIDAETFPGNAWDGMMPTHSDAFEHLYTLSFSATRMTQASGVLSSAGPSFQEKGHLRRVRRYNRILNDKGVLIE